MCVCAASQQYCTGKEILEGMIVFFFVGLLIFGLGGGDMGVSTLFFLFVPLVFRTSTKFCVQ